jgi:phenylacetate-coenzyme A ligase PaaK-like adenylate-forming protein
LIAFFCNLKIKLFYIFFIRLEEQHQLEIEEECKRQEEELMDIENQLDKEKKLRKQDIDKFSEDSKVQIRTVQGLEMSLQKSNAQIKV